MRENPKPFEQFEHFKGKRYQVLQIAKHSETMEEYVVYQGLYGNYEVYVRPLDMFLSEVDHVKYPQVKQKYRFTRIVNGSFVEETATVEDVTEKEKLQNGNEGVYEDITAQEQKLDPLLLEFLDTSSAEERLNILTALRDRITDEMIITIALVMDLELPEGSIEERYDQVRYALLAKKKYEGTRLR